MSKERAKGEQMKNRVINQTTKSAKVSKPSPSKSQSKTRIMGMTKKGRK